MKFYENVHILENHDELNVIQKSHDELNIIKNSNLRETTNLKFR